MANTAPMLIDHVRDLPNKEAYTTISVRQGYLEKPFNGVEGMVTRKIRISGVRLVWDEYAIARRGVDAEDASNSLFNFSGSSDIESLEMYADEVVIRSRLEFPQTNVWICARRLVFERSGCIVTTSLPYSTPARAERRSGDRPLDAAGQVKGKDGANGAKGGDVTVCLPEGANIIVPWPFGTPVERIVTVGGKGQDGEDGGYLEYSPNPGQEANPGDSSSCAFLTAANVEQVLYPQTDSWRFPDGWREDFKKFRVLHIDLDLFNDALLTAIGNPRFAHSIEEIGRREWPGGVPDAYPSGRGGDGGDGGLFRTFLPNGVAFSDATANFDSKFAAYTQALEAKIADLERKITSLIDAERKYRSAVDAGINSRLKLPLREQALLLKEELERGFKELGRAFNIRKVDNPISVHGEILNNLKQELALYKSRKVDNPFNVHVGIPNTSGGQPGASKAIPARRPQYPTDSGTPPAFMRMGLVRKTPPFESRRDPSKSIERCPFPIVAGQGSPARDGKPGQPARNAGPLSSEFTKSLTISPSEQEKGELLRKYPNGWPNSLVVEPVLRYARDAYLNGRRAEAREILETYKAVIDWVPAAHRSAALASQATEIATLLVQLDKNLDYYGNPPGWLPRLSLVSNLQLFMADQRNAVSLLYFAYKLRHSWEGVQDRARLLKSTRQALSAAIELAKKRFKEGLDLLESSRAELAAIERETNSIMRHVRDLNDTIAKNASDKAKEQAILAGVSSLASGLCKVIPVGQPFLGSAGSAVFDPLKEVDLTSDSALGEAFKFAGGVGSRLTGFVTENREALLEESEASFTRKLELLEGNFQATETEIEGINQTIEAEFDSKVAAYTRTLEAKIADLEGEITSVTDAARKKTTRTKALSLKQELALYKSRKLEEAILGLRKQVATAESAALTGEERSARDALLASLKTVQDRKARLVETKGTLAKRRDDQQVFLSGALDHAARIGQGIGGVAEGLAKLVVPIDPDSPAVATIKERIAQSAQYKPQFESLMRSVDDLGAKKQRMMEGIERAQHQLTESCATISKNLVQCAELGREYQALGNTLDLQVLQYAQDLKQRSEERLRKSLYHVVKSYEYHYLKRVPSDFFSTDVINKIVELEKAKQAAEDKGGLLGDEDFKAIYDTVFGEKFSQLGTRIIDDLQHLKPSMENKYLCVLEPDHLRQLNDTWRFDFKIVETFKKTSGRTEDVIGARIIGIAVKEFEAAAIGDAAPTPAVARAARRRQQGLSLDIEFTHSGEHVIADAAGFRYYFRIGKYPVEAQDGSGEKRWVDDHPIAWRMIYNAGGSDDDSGKITFDEAATDDKIATYLLREFKGEAASGGPLKLEEHRPGFTSTITLTIDGGLDLNNDTDKKRKVAKPFEVKKFAFFVFFKRQ